MKTRYSVSKKEFSTMTTEELRQQFLLEDLFVKGEINLTYSHIDRIIIGGAVPGDKVLRLPCGEELAAKSFLERSEMGVICIAGEGEVIIDNKTYNMKRHDGLYIGRGLKDVSFSSKDKLNPAYFYIASTPAHRDCQTTHIPLEKAIKVDLGCDKDCNKRTINKYIVPDTVESCQLTMGLTMLAEGSVWNTMPTHTHERRMEVYLYLDVDKEHVVFHMMGAPNETKHVVIKNNQAIISPSWSIHSGVGTKNYSFIWAMCGENQEFGDMQHVKTPSIK